MDFSQPGYVNSILNIMESLFSFIPSSTNTEELADISLYDHSNLTACIASCMYDYFQDQKLYNYRQLCYENNKTLRKEEIFLLVRAYISGIQDFIYTISSKGALKSLRGRSFYLELMTEHIADEILDALNLSRSNILYTGGGGFYLLLPNTQKSIETIKTMKKRANDFLLERFSVNLYIEFGWAGASAENLMSGNDGSSGMSPVYKKVSQEISKGKLSRYDENQLREIFTPKKPENGERECRICGTSSKLIINKDGESECRICNQLIDLGDRLVRSDSDETYLFTVCKGSEDRLRLPSFDGSDCYIKIDKVENIRNIIQDEKVVRVYSKNKYVAGLKCSTNLMVGDYSKVKGDYKNKPIEFEDLANRSEGISRLGVLRADVDNLGNLFANGFRPEGNNKELETLGRYTSISRSLSYFFKKAINFIARDRDYSLVIVYSGCDDLFVVGAWNEVICFADDVREYFKRFTCDALSFSAGIGFFRHNYPIARIAFEAGELENFSKRREGKDSVSLFGTEKIYSDHESNKLERVCRHSYS